jgi:hypothetical protein
MMKNFLLLLLFATNSVAVLKSQIKSDIDTLKVWKLTGGVHFFTKEIVKPNYEPVQGLTIYSKPAYDLSLEITRYFKLKKNLNSSLGLRVAYLPSNVGLDVIKNITRDNLAFDTYSKASLPYYALMGLVHFKVLENTKFTVIQSVGTSFVLVPKGFADYGISSSSSGTNIPYFDSKGFYNPNSLPFFSFLSETSLIYTKNGEKKWLLSLSFEFAPKDIIVSDYTFYSNKGELKGTLTRKYQQMGLQFGWFWTLKKRKNIE